jgi:hypothetical protein
LRLFAVILRVASGPGCIRRADQPRRPEQQQAIMNLDTEVGGMAQDLDHGLGKVSWFLPVIFAIRIVAASWLGKEVR